MSARLSHKEHGGGGRFTEISLANPDVFFRLCLVQFPRHSEHSDEDTGLNTVTITV